MLFSMYCYKQDSQRVFLGWIRNHSGVSQYTQGTWKLKSTVVLFNAQPFTRGLSIYNRVQEVPFYIPQGYMKCHSIYRWYMEEPCESRVVVRTNNDSSYVLRCLNTSLTHHSNFYKNFRPITTINFKVDG